MDQPSPQASLHESTSLAEIYEQHMVPAILAAWVPALVDLLSLQRGHHVPDVALWHRCGRTSCHPPRRPRRTCRRAGRPPEHVGDGQTDGSSDRVA